MIILTIQEHVDTTFKINNFSIVHVFFKILTEIKIKLGVFIIYL